MNVVQLNKFLVKAKINTYASDKAGIEKSLPNGSRELKFKENEIQYMDRYFGFNPFIGQEIVWQKEKVIWGMNYYGEIVLGIIQPEIIYQFLKEALKRITENKPFRGPDNFEKNDFKYINEVKGTTEKFEGCEIIYYREKPVYKLNYYGGLIAR